MTIGELMQTVRDIGSLSGDIASHTERGVVRLAVNIGLRHVCTTMRIPRFCYRGTLEPKRTVYRLDFTVSDITTVKVCCEKRDYPLTRMDIDMMNTAYGKYDPVAHAPLKEYVTENEAVSPSGIKFYAPEPRAPSSRNPEGAQLIWIRPASNTLVENGLWIFGVMMLPELKDDTQNIPIPEVYHMLAVYWALWLLTQKTQWMATYTATLPTVANYALESGMIDIPGRTF